MELVINGAARRVDGAASLEDVLRILDLDPRTVVVELNRAIVRRPALGATAVRDGDRIEVVHFVGGG